MANLLNNLVKTNLYNIYLLTSKPHIDDYELDDRIEKVDVYDGSLISKERLMAFYQSHKLDILIPNKYYDIKEINYLIDISHHLGIKVAVMIHSFLMHREFINENNKLFEFSKIYRKADCLISYSE